MPKKNKNQKVSLCSSSPILLHYFVNFTNTLKKGVGGGREKERHALNMLLIQVKIHQKFPIKLGK